MENNAVTNGDIENNGTIMHLFSIEAFILKSYICPININSTTFVSMIDTNLTYRSL